MSALLSEVLAAAGGLDRWYGYKTVRASIVTGGEFWGIKGLVQDPAPRAMVVRLHEQRSSVQPFGAPDQRTSFAPNRIAIEKLDGTVVAERTDPLVSFAGHTFDTPWDPLHRAYFNGYALWTYLNTPFLLAVPGAEVTEIEPITDGGEVLHGLRGAFPPEFAGHSGAQEFYFGADLLLRRHDYRVDVAGGFPAVQYASDYVEADGMKLPTRRLAYRAGPDGQADRSRVMVSIDFTDIGYA